jgi:hypothetical protein
MRNLVWKLRISVLWGAVAVLALMHMILEFAAPGAIDELRTGSLHGMDTDSPVTIMWVLFVLVPLLMAFLTFVVPDVPGRWVSGLLGVASAVLWFPLPGSEETVSAGALLVTASVIVASLLIVWFAWRGPAERAVEVRREHARQS